MPVVHAIAIGEMLVPVVHARAIGECLLLMHELLER